MADLFKKIISSSLMDTSKKESGMASVERLAKMVKFILINGQMVDKLKIKMRKMSIGKDEDDY